MEFLITLLSLTKEHFTDSVLIICVVALFGYQIYQSRQAKKYAEKASAEIEETKNACVVQYTHEPLSKQLVNLVKTSVNINKHLDRLLYDLCADRAQLYVFHNSGHDLLGQPFAKLTNTNESVTPGVDSILHLRKDLPIGLLAYFIDDLLDNEEANYPNVEEMGDSGVVRYFKTMGIKSCYAIALFAPKKHEFDNPTKSSKGSIPLGFVVVDYVRKTKDLTEIEKRRVLETSMIIKGELVARINNLIESQENGHG